MTENELIKKAKEAMNRAYAPYSCFRVGAALIGGSGNVYTGANIENISFGATICAERTAVFKAISEGESKLKIIAIASDSEDYIHPCGICRQVLAEFSEKSLRVLCSNKKGDFREYTLEQLLPNAFIDKGGK
ncbi:MAG: cytidine deaminase [Ruminiclostridium sp.]|nr:cytidine deaminase [Ruminiclostridium sp.]